MISEVLNIKMYMQGIEKQFGDNPTYIGLQDNKTLLTSNHRVVYIFIAEMHMFTFWHNSLFKNDSVVV
jgi:hypothetical protein